MRTIKEVFAIPAKDVSWQQAYNTTSINKGNLNSVIDGQVKNRYEEEGMAPKVLPFPLDRVTDEIVNCYESYVKVKSILMQTLRYAILNDAEKKAIRKHLKLVNNILAATKKMSEEIEQITL